jgi:hypothetical protein
MFRRVALLSLVLLAQATGASAYGLPKLELLWDTCWPTGSDSDHLQDFEGPGTYRQVMSAWEFGFPLTGIAVDIVVNAVDLDVDRCAPLPLPDAWRFDAAGCQAGRLTFSRAAVAEDCPAFAPPGAVEVAQFEYDDYSLASHVRLQLSFPVFTPDPTVRYSLWQIAYDHTNSAAGEAGGGSCGGAEIQMCFKYGGTWTDAEGTTRYFNDFGCPHWQAPDWLGSSCNCLCVAARGSTWGRLKGLYR